VERFVESFAPAMTRMRIVMPLGHKPEASSLDCFAGCVSFVAQRD
jgi:hypothetical protein